MNFQHPVGGKKFRKENLKNNSNVVDGQKKKDEKKNRLKEKTTNYKDV